MLRISVFLAALLGLGVWSCQTPIPEPRPGYAICGPCADAGDLGCVEVKMGPEAAQARVNGQTWWFCSEICRDQFLELHPGAEIVANQAGQSGQTGP